MSHAWRVVVVGASSALVTATLRNLVSLRPVNLYLLGRDADKLALVQSDLMVRGAKSCSINAQPVDQVNMHAAWLKQAQASLQGIDVMLLGYGVLGDVLLHEQDIDVALAHVHTNFVSYVSWLLHVANLFEKQKHGQLVVFSSVAGLRGRASNYVYGASKAGLTALCSGLRSRLFRHGIPVLTVLPGPVHSPMTMHLPPSMLTAEADKVGRSIAKAMVQKRNQDFYVPGFWRMVMNALGALPEPWFSRLMARR